MVHRDPSATLNARGAAHAQQTSKGASSTVLALPAIGSTSTASMPSQLAASRDMQGWLSKWSLRRAAQQSVSVQIGNRLRRSARLGARKCTLTANADLNSKSVFTVDCARPSRNSPAPTPRPHDIHAFTGCSPQITLHLTWPDLYYIIIDRTFFRS